MADKSFNDDTTMPDAPPSSSAPPGSPNYSTPSSPAYTMFSPQQSTGKAWEPQRPRDPDAEFSSEDERSSGDERDSEIKADTANKAAIRKTSISDRFISLNDEQTLTNLAIALAARNFRATPKELKIMSTDGLSMIDESPSRLRLSDAEKQAKAVTQPKHVAFLEKQFKARVRFLAEAHNKRFDREKAKAVKKAADKGKATAAAAVSAAPTQAPRRVRPQPSAFTLELPMRGPRKDARK